MCAAQIAYQGEPGAFSEQALRHFGGDSAESLPCHGFEDVFAALATGRANYAVVPCANSLAGPVPGVVRLLASEPVKILDTFDLQVEQCLIAAPGVKLADLRHIYSHPVALRQCRKLQEKSPSWRFHAVDDTAGAVARVMRNARPDEAAIASRHAAVLYGGEVLAKNIQDSEVNVTSFYLLTIASSNYRPIVPVIPA